MMTSKSKSANIDASVRGGRGCGADEAGHGCSPLDPAHAEGHHDIDCDVDDGGGSEGLEYLERKFLHGARAGRELHEHDSECDSAVLDDVENFGSEGRHDDDIRY